MSEGKATQKLIILAASCSLQVTGLASTSPRRHRLTNLRTRGQICQSANLHQKNEHRTVEWLVLPAPNQIKTPCLERLIMGLCTLIPFTKETGKSSQPFRTKNSQRRTLLFDPSPTSKRRCEAAPMKCASIMGSVSMPQSGLDLCVWSRMPQEDFPETLEPREDGKLNPSIWEPSF